MRDLSASELKEVSGGVDTITVIARKSGTWGGRWEMTAADGSYDSSVVNTLERENDRRVAHDAFYHGDFSSSEINTSEVEQVNMYNSISGQNATGYALKSGYGFYIPNGDGTYAFYGDLLGS